MKGSLLDYARESIQLAGNSTLASIEQILTAIRTLLTGASTSSPTNVNVTNVSTAVLAANPNRKMATFYNDGGGNIYLKLGAGALTTSFTVRLTDNSYYELPLPIYTGAITAVTASGTRALRVTEY